MKTKILSVLLACLMVLSVMPFAAFADTTVKCTIVGDAEHTLETCPDAKKLETVPSKCGELGYTLYQCPACNEYFAANFNTIEGNHLWEVVEAAVPATCTTVGKEALEKCSECGKERGGNEVAMLNHTWDKTEGNCVTGGTQKCSVCGKEEAYGTAGAGHDWEKIPTIKTEPFCGLDAEGNLVYVDGEAVFACKNCEDTKTVVIKANHVKETLDYHAPKAPTCTEEGNVAYWECSVCGVCYTDFENGIFFANDEGVVIEKLPHTPPSDYKGPTCNESATYTCTVCGEEQFEKALDHDYDVNSTPTLFQDSTCSEYGVKVWVCLACGEDAQVQLVSKKPHTAPAGYVAPVCGEKDKPFICDLCGEIDPGKAPEHTLSLKPGEVKKNCKTAAYTFQYCTNPDCSLPVVSTVVVENVTYDVTVMVKGSNDPTTRTGVHYIEGSLKVDTEGGKDDAADHLDRQISAIHQEATCDKPLITVYYCLYCKEHKYVTGEKLAHKWVDVATHDATCDKAGYTEQECELCGDTREVEDSTKPALGHDWDNGVETTFATCTTEGVKTYTCALCKTTKTEVLPKHTHAIEYTVEEVAIRHPNAYWELDYMPGNCIDKGLYKYKCPDCGELPLVVKPGTAIGAHKMPAGKELEIIEGDCVTDGYIPAYTCELCGMNIAEVKITAPGHTADPSIACPAAQVCLVCGEDMSAAGAKHDMEKVAAKAATCTEAGWNAHKACTLCDYKERYKEIAPLNHKNIGVAFERDFTCTLFGFTHIMCPDCKGDANGDKVFGDKEVEYIVAYRKALGHDWVLNETASYDPTCEKDGADVYDCAHGNRCLDEEGKAIGQKTEVVPATRHMNAAGELFDNDCMDPVEDRNCVNEHCDVAPDANGVRLIGKDHNEATLIVKEVEATCILEAYILKLCPNCGEHWVEKGSYEIAIGKHIWERTGATSDYWEYELDENGNEILPTFTKPAKMFRKCTDCGLVEWKDVTKTGIEFTLETNNGVVPGAEYADSSLVAVKIKLDSAKVDVWAIRLNLAYDANVVEYVKTEFVTELFTVNQLANDNNGYVTLLADVANVEAQVGQNKTIEGKSDFAVVYFRINNATATGTTFSFGDTEAIQWSATKEDGNQISVDTDATASIAIRKFLDQNKDGDVTLEDAIALYNHVLKSKYDVAIDTDKDGDITLADLLNLYDFLSHAKSYEDMVALGV